MLLPVFTSAQGRLAGHGKEKGDLRSAEDTQTRLRAFYIQIKMVSCGRTIRYIEPLPYEHGNGNSLHSNEFSICPWFPTHFQAVGFLMSVASLLECTDVFLKSKSFGEERGASLKRVTRKEMALGVPKDSQSEVSKGVETAVWA